MQQMKTLVDKETMEEAEAMGGDGRKRKADALQVAKDLRMSNVEFCDAADFAWLKAIGKSFDFFPAQRTLFAVERRGDA